MTNLAVSRRPFLNGMRDGIPIMLAYISVSFTFGMMAVENGFSPLTAVLISMTNLTSAGQFAGTALILSCASYFEIGLTTFIINIRYMLMSFSLTQKLESRITMLQRALISFGVTDEIFAVASGQKGELSTAYMAGLISLPYCGWALGTLLGAAASNFLPESIRGALGIAIYAMFIAIIIPPAKYSRAIQVVILTAVAISCLFAWMPGLNQLSSGFVIIIAAVAASTLGALLFPLNELETTQEVQNHECD